MKYRKIGLLIMTSVFCLAMTQIAGANSVLKTVYFDGVKAGNGTAGPQELSYLFNRLTIGCEGSQYYRYLGLKGQIDDFAVYNSVLSDARIKGHFDANTTAAIYEANVATDNPLLYLKFQDASSANGATALNSGTAGATLNGKYYGAIVLQTGRFAGANAAKLSGASGGTGDCIDVPDTTGTISTSNVTVELWVCLDANAATTTYPRLFQHNNGDTKMGSYGGMYVTDSCSIGAIGGGQTGYVVRNLSSGWHHVVITYKSVIVAVDRSYPTEVKSDNPCVYLRYEDETQMEELGRAWRYYYKYGTTKYDHNLPTLVAYGDPGEQRRTDCKKAGGIGDSIFLNTWPVHHTGPPAGWGSDAHSCISNAMGSGGAWKITYETIKDDPNWGFAKGDITYEFWIKRSGTDDKKWELRNRRFLAFEDSGSPEPNIYDTNEYPYFSTIFSQADTNNPAGAPQMDFADGNSIVPAGNIRVRVGVAVGDPNSRQNDWYTGIQISDTQWHQLVLVYDVNGIGDPCRYGPGNGDDTNVMNVYLYKDGVLAASLFVQDPNRDQAGKGAGNAKLGAWRNHLNIGAAGSWGFSYNGFSGYMDEVAIYPAVLPADRILAHYAAWQPRSCIDAINRGTKIVADLDGDCDVDFVDFAELALGWASCNDPVGGGSCVKNW